MKQPDAVGKYTHRVTWAEEDQEQVGLCAEFPSLSWLDKSQAGVRRSIVEAVRQAVVDMMKAHESIPELLAGMSRRGGEPRMLTLPL